MSYDLMVFEPAAAPLDRAEFLAWFDRQAEWGEGHDYNDPANTTERMRAWFFEFTKTFPPMNGPHASKDYDDPKISDYSIGRSVIYAGFAWSQAEAAYNAMFDTAKKFGLGFYDVSAESGEVWLPNSQGEFVCVHRG
jgi:hypothetical protein